MRRLASPWPLLLAAAACSSGALSCSKSEPQGEDTAAATSATTTATSAEPEFVSIVPLSFKPTPEQVARAGELVGHVKKTAMSLPREFQFAPGDEIAAVIVAASRADIHYISAALQVIGKRKPGSEPTADELAVLLHHFQASDSRVVTRAVQASKPFISGNKPNAELLNAVITAGRSPSFRAGRERYWLLDSLGAVSLRKRGEAQQMIEESVKSIEGFVAVRALELLHNPRLGMRSDPELAKVAEYALRHSDPGARGLAAAMFVKVTKGQEGVAEKILPLLVDEHPYVRSQAAEALALLDYKPAIHVLAKLTDDLAKNSYRYDVITYEPTFPRTLHSSHWPHVAAAALDAIEKLAGPELKLEPVKPADVEGSLKERSAAFKKWYAANKAKIAAAPDVPEPPKAQAKAPAAQKKPNTPVDKPAAAPAPKP